jgi:hypothetical protein
MPCHPLVAASKPRKHHQRQQKSSPTQVAAIKVISRSTSRRPIPSIHSCESQALTGLLRGSDLRLQRHSALINGLQLAEVRVEDADDLRDLG